MHPKIKVYELTNADFSVREFVAVRGVKCSHWGNTCLKLAAGWSVLEISTIWEANIDLKALLGNDKKVTQITLKGMIDTSPGTQFSHEQKIILEGDGTKITSWARISDAEETFEDSTFKPNVDVTYYDTLTVLIRQAFTCFFGGVELHTAKIMVTIEYDAFEMPARCDIDAYVKDDVTGILIKGAYVRLMKSDVVVRSGTTDGGKVSWTGVSEGTYTLRISAGGYYDFERALAVAPPAIEAIAYMIPIPKEPTPWYVYAGLAGVGLISVVAIGGVLSKPPIMVMK